MNSVKNVLFEIENKRTYTVLVSIPLATQLSTEISMYSKSTVLIQTDGLPKKYAFMK